jgi:hypothetical protein
LRCKNKQYFRIRAMAANICMHLQAAKSTTDNIKKLSWLAVACGVSWLRATAGRARRSKMSAPRRGGPASRGAEDRARDALEAWVAKAPAARISTSRRKPRPRRATDPAPSWFGDHRGNARAFGPAANAGASIAARRRRASAGASRRCWRNERRYCRQVWGGVDTSGMLAKAAGAGTAAFLA